MQTAPRHNYYEVLELSANAPQSDIKRAYERVKTTYSGENPAIYTIFSEAEARELLCMIEEAYSILGNNNLRTIYDQRLLSGLFSVHDLTYASIIEASKNLGVEKKPEVKQAAYKKDENFEQEILSCENWNGTFLKRVREYKELTVRRIHEITKINGYYITAIENMDVSSLPATVFIRGYVLQIAKALHLDEKKVADSYMKLLKEQIKS